MLTRGKVLLLTILCLLSLVSIGFASWTITGDDEEEFMSGSFSTDNVIYSKEYINLNTDKGEGNSGISCFKYYEKGYLDNDGYISNYGYITTYYIIEYSDLIELLDVLDSETDSINVSFRLQYSDQVILGNNYYNLFSGNTSSAGSSSISATCSYSDIYSNVPTISYSQQSEKGHPSYLVNITFEKILENYSQAISPEFICFEIQYALFATVGDYFENNIYSFLYSKMISTSSDFKVDITLSGS